MGAAAKTPKAVVQIMLAVAYDKSNAAPDAIVEHEQLKYREHFEAIAKARKIDALTSVWKLLSEGLSLEEFERRGFGQAIRSKARALLLSEQRRAGNTGAGAAVDSLMDKYTSGGVLPPRVGQAAVSPSAEEKPNKRSRKKAL